MISLLLLLLLLLSQKDDNKGKLNELFLKNYS